MSLTAILVMTILFLSETFAFLHTIMATSIALDENDQPQIRLNFNITLLDLHCNANNNEDCATIYALQVLIIGTVENSLAKKLTRRSFRLLDSICDPIIKHFYFLVYFISTLLTQF